MVTNDAGRYSVLVSDKKYISTVGNDVHRSSKAEFNASTWR